ncbi:hypothetical protein VNO77_43921 [Canavalia gladiata]|uniref:Uncharacterized protein n=1 Tax=Canavalia gladiata TaxID=3824 RepID=A0AAN9JY03_CANGL
MKDLEAEAMQAFKACQPNSTLTMRGVILGGHEQDPFIAAKLANEYARLTSSNLEHAPKMFDEIPHRDIVADIHGGYWTHCFVVKTRMRLDLAVGSGHISLCYGMHCLTQEPLSLLHEYIKAGVEKVTAQLVVPSN